MNRKFELLDMHESDNLKNEIIICYIDIVSTCNLICPTCPQGNMDSIPGGIMQLELFKKIINKLKLDFPKLKDIGLYNWTEPLLHNKLADFIEVVKKAGFRCLISTNLNHSKNLEEIIIKNPNTIRVSLSGFTQDVYKIGHLNGNIETVKKNMKILSNLIKKHNSDTKIIVVYLKYNHNLSEIPAMKEYALSLGFNFATFWSYLMSVENALQYIRTPEKIDKNTMNVIQHLGIEPKKLLNSLKKIDSDRCYMLENELVLNAAGEIQQCCASLTPPFLNKTYLELTPDEIFNRRHNANVCSTCMKAGLHTMYRTKWSDDEWSSPKKPKKSEKKGIINKILKKF